MRAASLASLSYLRLLRDISFVPSKAFQMLLFDLSYPSYILLLDFLWMTERHDLCKPSALIAKDEDVAARIDKKMQDKESGIDLIELK